MEKRSSTRVMLLVSSIRDFMKRSIFRILMAGPIPNHIAFIMDGNQRFAKKRHMVVGDGHKAGFESLITILNYCYQLGVKHVTVYTFSIENFKRKPEEVQQLMDLMVNKIEELLEGSFLSKYGIRLYFIGNLGLLGERVRLASEKAMKATAGNSRAVLLICVAYTSYDEIVHAVEESCREKLNCTEHIIESFNGPIENGHCIDEYGGRKPTQNENGYTSHSLEELQERHSCEIEDATEGLVCNGGTDQSDDARLISRISDVTEDREKCPVIKLADIERHMYMAVAPDPDSLIGGDPFEQLPIVADCIQPIVLSDCSVARDRTMAVSLGSSRLPKKLLLHTKEKKTGVKLGFSETVLYSSCDSQSFCV